MKFKYFVYLLIDPEDKSVKYVGCTNNPDRRLQWHIKQSSSNYNYDNKKKKWIDSLSEKRLEPILNIIAGFTNREQAEYFEALLIKAYFLTGVSLVNVNNRKIT